MKLLIFLGNPGGKYEHTHHNAGFLAGDFLREKWNFPVFTEERKFFGKLSRKNDLFFLKPETFMNLSGKSARAIADFFKISPENILLIFDDKDLPFGEVRFRERGSAGGHNGVSDILRVFSTEEIARVKIGVANEKMSFFAETADFVLSRFSAEELEKLEKNVFPIVGEKVESWIKKEEK